MICCCEVVDAAALRPAACREHLGQCAHRRRRTRLVVRRRSGLGTAGRRGDDRPAGACVRRSVAVLAAATRARHRHEPVAEFRLQRQRIGRHSGQQQVRDDDAARRPSRLVGRRFRLHAAVGRRRSTVVVVQVPRNPHHRHQGTQGLQGDHGTFCVASMHGVAK